MKIMSWYGVRAAAVGVALVIAWCGSAFAQLSSSHFEVDENCHGAFINSSFTFTLPCSLRTDPGPGGLPSVVTYDLLTGPGFIVPGDVLLTEGVGGAVNDVIRFQDNSTLPTTRGASLVFYSDNIGGFDALADTASPPGALYTNMLSIPEVGPEGNNGVTYIPIAGQPGFCQACG